MKSSGRGEEEGRESKGRGRGEEREKESKVRLDLIDALYKNGWSDCYTAEWNGGGRVRGRNGEREVEREGG